MMRKFVLLSLIVSVLFSCESVTSHVNPAITLKYANAEIDSLIAVNEKSTGQKIRVPEANLQQQFFSDFPSAKDVDWEKAGDLIMVEFEIGNTGYDGFYDTEFNLLKYEYEVHEADLPAVVKNSSVAKYPDYHIDDVKKIVRGTETFYCLELEKDDRKVHMFLKQDGTISDYTL